jgi:flagellar biogenesis protein FliO
MPGLFIRPILISGLIIISIFIVAKKLAAEEPNQAFPAKPKASFAPSNFTAAPTPPPSKSSAQLYSFRDGLSASPQFQTPNRRNQEPPVIQQVSAMEPLPQPTLPPTSQSQIPQSPQTVENISFKSVAAQKEDKLNQNDQRLNSQFETFNETKNDRGMIGGEKEFDNKENNTENNSENNTENNEHLEGNLLDRAIGLGKDHSGKGIMERPKIVGAITPLISVLGSLLIVIAIFFILVLFLKKVSPKGNRLLPQEAFEDLGRAMLTQKLQLHLLRLGNRLILVSITPDGVSPVTEITDPDEVVPLLGMCRQLDKNSSSELFRKTLNSFASEKAEGGYFGTEMKKTTPKNKGKTKNSLLGNLYSDPDESLAEMLAKGGQHE